MDLTDQLPLHGGDIIAASKRYDIPEDKWIDLSTGMNPEPYPMPEIPLEAFQHLPYLQDAFIQAAAAYYCSEQCIPIAGSQAAIQQLPGVLNPEKLPILLPQIGYKEHENYWAQHGASLSFYPSLENTPMVDTINASLQQNNQQHLLVINPNNPTAVLINKSQLLTWAETLAERAYLIVDEAFIDLTPEYSLLSDADLPANIIVLRSFGKFFGLAGLRLGFVFGHDDVLGKLQSKIGLWQVNGPAQFIATKAFKDKKWQAAARLRIIENATQTQELFLPLMRSLNVVTTYANGLFESYYMKYTQAVELADTLATKGILTRVVDIDGAHALLRIGTLSMLDGGDVSADFLRVQEVVGGL